jgi:hypothetical protein
MNGAGSPWAKRSSGVIAVLLAGLCFAAPAGAEDAWRSRVTGALLDLYDAAASVSLAPAAATPAVRAVRGVPGPGAVPRVDAGGRVQVDVHYDCALAAPAAALGAAGLALGAAVRFGPFCVIEGWVAPSQLAQVAAVAGVLRVQVPAYALQRRPPAPATRLRVQQAQPRASPPSGIDANGVAIMRADQFVSQTGTGGAGAMVGVQSTGVASLSLIQGRGELPAVQVLVPSGGSPSTSDDEGTVLLEEVHAVAPAAGLAFCGPQTFVDYTSCLSRLIAAGATILIDDINFLPQDLMSSTGSDAQAVDAILAQNPNVALFTVTGNANGSYWEGSYAPVPVAAAGLAPLSCTTGSTTQVDSYVAQFGGTASESLSVTELNQFPLVLAWADPYGQNASNFDLYLYSSGSQVGCLSAAGSSDTLISTSIETGYTLYVGTPDTTLAGKFLKLWAGGDGLTALDPSTSGSIVSPQAFATGIITIGAVDGADGVGNGIESFSSLGPLRLALPVPQALQAPTLVAPDGINVDAVNTYFESYLFPDGNFYGTSASVPNAAGVAALLRGAFPELTVAQLRSALQGGATALGTIVPDGSFGYGRIDAIGALGTLPLPTLSPLPDSTIVGGASSPPLAFTTGATGNVHFSVASTNPALVPAALSADGAPGVTVAPAGCGTSTFSCTLSVTPAIGQTGTASVTVSALDGANRAAPATMHITVTKPAGPTLDIDTGANQEYTAGAGTAAPVAFAVTGTGPLAITALSSNAALVPATNLAVSPGCGTSTRSCNLAIAVAAGVSGSATITITVTDAYGQSMSAPAVLQVDPGAGGASSSSGGASSSSGGAGAGGGARGAGGGGTLQWWELAIIASLAGHRLWLRRRSGACSSAALALRF